MNRYQLYGIKNWFRIPIWALDITRRNWKKEKYSFQSNFHMIQKMCKKIVQKGNVSVQIIGIENIPKETGYAMYVNHQGFFDGLGLMSVLPDPFHFLVMKEMKKMAYVKYVMSLLDCVYIDRDDLRQSLHAINDCTDLLKDKQNVLIFPEGTLEKNENELLKFKPGAFKAAVRAKAPIIPVALENSFLPFDREGIAPCQVKIQILPPIIYEQYQSFKTIELAEIVENQIQACIK